MLDNKDKLNKTIESLLHLGSISNFELNLIRFDRKL
jgi:hypothetical protein